MVPVLILLALTTLSGSHALAQAWPETDFDALATALDASPTVQQAALEVEDARLALASSSAVVSGSLRTSGSVDWDATEGWGAGLGAITLSTQWRVFAAGSSYDAYLRAQENLQDAEAGLADTRRTAALDALARLWELQRLRAETAIAAERLGLAQRQEEAVHRQHAAGAVTDSALDEARLATLQAELSLNESQLDEAEAELAFQKDFGILADTLAPVEAGVVAHLIEVAEAADLPPFIAVETAELTRAVQVSTTVRNAANALEQALQGLADAQRGNRPSTSVSASFNTAGDSGAVSLSGGWDSSSMQPSLSLSVDPWSAQSTRTGAQLSLAVTIPLDPSAGTDLAREKLTVSAAESSLVRAEQNAALELDGRLRSLAVSQANLDLARSRLTLRKTSLDSLRTRADFGSVSPLDLLAGELDAAEAALAVLRSMDQLVLAQTELELLLQRDPSHPILAAAISAATASSTAPEAPR